MPKRIALVAHDTRKRDLAEWVTFNREKLIPHQIVCTGSTGKLVCKALGDGAQVRALKSGPLGGDQQMGALIAEDEIDLLIFLWEPMMPQPHDVDVKALLRLAVVYNLPMACNIATADFLISSPHFNGDYAPRRKDYSDYLNRSLDG
ncbi:MAG: methylglyoxal synthase [Candidatus Melainabacteria bacterium HGW-Melainabacteria-1]|nr:MAG: methylglyoxal synthase [Candidatus Melainabacteria bacterium HGW-Melainabacteria-1]